MASLSCGATCMKYILFIFNIAFFLTGAAILGVGIWLRVDPNASRIIQVINLSSNGGLLNAATGVLIGVGAFIFLVGFLGCCGACRESSCMLCMYAGLLVLVFILEITAAILAIVFRGRIVSTIDKSMEEQVKTQVTGNPKDAVTLAWNGIQFGLKCCGANNYTDYVDSNFSRTTNMKIPHTCCKMDELKTDNPQANNYAKCVQDFDSGNTNGELYTKGCTQSIKDWLNRNAGILIGVGIGIAFIQLLGIVLACCVRKEILRGKRQL